MNSMPALIHLSGPFGNVLVLLALVVLGLSGRAVWTAARSGGSLTPALEEQTNSILFWGGAAGVMGFLGQCQGTYLALSAIMAAAEINPHVVAQGFVISFLPTLMGLGILSYAAVTWACLRLLPRRPAGTLSLFLLLLVIGGCTSVPREPPADVTRGVWAMEAGGDLFLWEFYREGVRAPNGGEGGAGGPLQCVVHDFLGGLKNMETPCGSASVEGLDLELEMLNGVRYEGSVDLSRGSIEGSLLYLDGTSMEAPMEWAPLADYPSLLPRPEDEGSYVYSSPEERDDGWPVAHAAGQGVDPEALEATVASVTRGDAGFLKSLLIVRGDSLILEEYFHGYGPQDLSPIKSCTKSVSSLLLGLAIQEGHIQSIQEPLLGFFPQAAGGAGEGWENLTLEHLLTMSMALDWSPEEEQSLQGTGPVGFSRVLARTVAGQPGVDWAYVNVNVNLIAGVLKQATGEHADAFAARTLFTPLGITDWDWDYGKTDGFNLMSGSLRLRPRDMAKIGAMVMNGGVWKGESVVKESWIRRSLTSHLPAGTGGEGYGYLWWTRELPTPSGEILHMAFANGWGSQFILLLPELDLVIVTTGGNMENGKHLAFGDVLLRDLIPGVSSGPLHHISQGT